mmetsp:Transcript_6028/g.17026  ORF Transcript_6028/g.17026 Transcript_6028/m.17026 type:complete len:202 (-) Transcript_6028:1631-2236(-)
MPHRSAFSIVVLRKVPPSVQHGATTAMISRNSVSGSTSAGSPMTESGEYGSKSGNLAWRKSCTGRSWSSAGSEEWRRAYSSPARSRRPSVLANPSVLRRTGARRRISGITCSSDVGSMLGRRWATRARCAASSGPSRSLGTTVTIFWNVSRASRVASTGSHRTAPSTRAPITARAHSGESRQRQRTTAWQSASARGLWALS